MLCHRKAGSDGVRASPHVAPAVQRVRTSAPKVYWRIGVTSITNPAPKATKRLNRPEKSPQPGGIGEVEGSQIVVQSRVSNAQRDFFSVTSMLMIEYRSAGTFTLGPAPALILSRAVKPFLT